MGLLPKKKKNKEIEYDEYGISMGMPDKQERMDSLFLCISKSLVLFCIVFGTIGFYFGCFDIKCYMPVVGIGILIFSAVSGFLYYNGWTKNLGYLLVLVIFATMAYYFYAPANSGFAAILNKTYEVVDDEFIFDYYNIFTERIPDRAYTVTVCSLFLGFFGCLLLNIALTGKLGPLYFLLMLAPLYAMGLFFNGNAPLWSVLFLSAGIISMIIMRRECKIMDKKRRGYKKKRRKGDYYYFFDGKSLLGIFRQVFAGCFVMFLILILIIPEKAINYPASWGKLKESTRDGVRTYFLLGAAGLFYHYQGTGGLSGGQLGRVGSVRPDYEVDLNVTLVPYDYDRIYLKGYTGTEYMYGENRWLTMGELKQYYGMNPSGFEEMEFTRAQVDFTANQIEKWYNEKKQGISSSMKKDFSSGIIYTKMRVKNLDANTRYVYAPYYTKMDGQDDVYISGDDEIRADFPTDTTKEFIVYQVNENVFELEDEDSDWDREYRSYVKDNYMFVPHELDETMGRIYMEADLTGTKEEIASKIIKYFDENYSYTLRPGLLPWRKDFVSYFLDKNKQGYCAHFATAATLLFRYAGIPARYCEGYVVDYDQVLEGDEENEEKVSEWFDGELREWDKTLVVTADVTDADAHGWVEIYLDGYGWVPVETTPAASSNEGYESFLESFFGLFSNQDDNEGQKDDKGNNDGVGGISIDSSVVLWVGIILMAGALGWFFYRFVMFQRERRGSSDKNTRDRLRCKYHYYQKVLSVTGKEQKNNETLTEYRNRMKVIFPEEEKTNRFFEVLEMAFYGYMENYEGFSECESMLQEKIEKQENELTIKQWVKLYLM